MSGFRVRWTGTPLVPGSPLAEAATDVGLMEHPEGSPVLLKQQGEGFSVRIGEASAEVSYQDAGHLARALGHLAAHLGEPGWSLTETRGFRSLGAMTDASRNAIATVSTLKTFLRAISVMGYNQLMMYMEDTYEVPEHPYFGHLRGRYTADELRQIDDYAFALGIEVVPCIQTLAHLPRFLHWRSTAHLRDNFEILLSGEEATYSLLDDMIRAVTSPLRSRKIHLGMDEAFEVGLGRYLTLHGPRNRFDIVNAHLARVVDIGKKYGLSPIMWSDMYFRLADPSGDYAADHIPAGVAEAIHPDVQLVYWDYFSTDKSFYLRKMRQHEEMKPGTMFAGSVWTYNGFAVSYNKTFLTTLPALAACKETGVRDVLVTLWGDDGSECHFAQSLYGLQLYAEAAFGPGGDDVENYDFERLSRRFRECTGADPEAFLALDLVDNVKPLQRNKAAFNTSKQAFYQDVLFGPFDKHLEGLDLNHHFAVLVERFRAWSLASNRWAYLFKPLALYCDVLALKAELGLSLKQAYDADDRAALAALVPTIAEVKHRVTAFHQAYNETWDRDFKPFGGEVIDIKLGALESRLNRAAQRVSAYTEGRLNELPELAAPRLWYDGRSEQGEQQELRFNRWHQTVTTGYISHNVH